MNPRAVLLITGATVMTMPLPVSRLSAAAAVVLQEIRSSESGILVPPPRSRPEPRAVPDVPAEAAPALLTATVTVHATFGKRVEIRRQIVTRSADRVHVMATPTQEWLLVRNPVDGRRVSGFLVHHDAKTIVAHEESDLRSRAGVYGWADAIMFGLSAELIGQMRPGRETRVISGWTYRRYEPAGDGIVRDLWWNAERLLPERYTLSGAGGLVHVTVNRVQPSVDARLLTLPAERFTGYRIVDVAAWLER